MGRLVKFTPVQGIGRRTALCRCLRGARRQTNSPCAGQEANLSPQKFRRERGKLVLARAESLRCSVERAGDRLNRNPKTGAGLSLIRLGILNGVRRLESLN